VKHKTPNHVWKIFKPTL